MRHAFTHFPFIYVFMHYTTFISGLSILCGIFMEPFTLVHFVEPIMAFWRAFIITVTVLPPSLSINGSKLKF